MPCLRVTWTSTVKWPLSADRGRQANPRYAEAWDQKTLNWDDDDQRRIILRGPAAVSSVFNAPSLRHPKPVVVFDELHKYPRWKRFLKGFFDSYGQRFGIVVTGSSRMDIYRRGGDSLMGRYFLYRMHPLSVRELADPVPGWRRTQHATCLRRWKDGRTVDSGNFRFIICGTRISVKWISWSCATASRGSW